MLSLWRPPCDLRDCPRDPSSCIARLHIWQLWVPRLRVPREPGKGSKASFQFFIFNWLMIGLQYWFDFCHTTWINHRGAYQLSSVVSDSLQPHGLQHTRPPCPSLTLEFTQTHVHWVGDAIQPSHPLSSPSPPTFSCSQHQGLFKWVSSSHQVA